MSETQPLVGDRYYLGEYLGESRLGQTYQAHDSETDQTVELMFLDGELIGDIEAADARLQRLANLPHLHLLPLLDWQLDDAPYLVYAAPAMRLDRLVEFGVALTPSQTLLIGLQAAETLHSLRQLGIAHGALDLSHCCVDLRGKLQLAEVGVDFLRRSPRPDGATGYDGPEAVASLADPVSRAAAADVFGLATLLAEAAVGRPVELGEVSQLGRSVVPADAGAATTRNLALLAPLLAQASATRPEDRLEVDELALALRATAERFPPPTRLDEAFQRVEELQTAATAVLTTAADEAPQSARQRAPVIRLAAAAAVVLAGVLLVILTAPGGGTPSRVVPDVVGMNWPQASETLEELGWGVRRLEVRVPGVAPEEVVGQLPSSGGLLDEGQVVKVQVTLGEPLVVIPADIVGMTVEEAGLRLSEAGLTLGWVEMRRNDTAPEGSVLAVSEMLPELPRGGEVDLVVSTGG